MSYFRKPGMGADDLPSACSPSSESYDPDVCVAVYSPAPGTSPPTTSWFNDAIKSVTGGGSSSAPGTSPSGKSGIPTIVIVGGIAVGAWFLFGKKKKR